MKRLLLLAAGAITGAVTVGVYVWVADQLDNIDEAWR